MNSASMPRLTSWDELAREAQRLGFPGRSREILTTPSRSELEAIKLRLRLFCELREQGDRPPGGTSPSTAVSWTEELTAHRLIFELAEVSLERFRVVGAYMRSDDQVRNYLKDAYLNIRRGLSTFTQVRENHLIWAPSSQGKTFLVEETVAIMKDVAYFPLDLSKLSQEEMVVGLDAIYRSKKACLCLVDEIDSKSEEDWPYEILLDHLLANARGRSHVVFVLAGSTGLTILEFKSRILQRRKGDDLLKRIAYEYAVPLMELGDKILVFLGHLKREGKESCKNVREVERMALYYVAISPKLYNPREVRDLARRVIRRLPDGEDRVKYDFLWEPGDPDERRFWTQYQEASLVGKYVFVDD